ncbi:TraR/DksA C4-type zinc finger protein [Providencia stuartii]|uniref:TraR/DksA C4-type zinc finger protein n=1 Tax=Providencia stuartii TaxID=588 RepID=UPI001120ACF4|nr:TraR/DksA C4-type zinc finger protein [Providencia stuartii]
MSKEIDIASEQEELLRENQIKTITNRPRGVSAFFCSYCERPIPENRRIAYLGCSTCIDCQTILEIKTRHYRSV